MAGIKLLLLNQCRDKYKISSHHNILFIFKSFKEDSPVKGSIERKL
jgi:hypothetical protein